MDTIKNKIEATLHSLDNIQSMEVSLDFKNSIKTNFRLKEKVVSVAQKWMIAASICALLGVNVITITKYSKNKSSNSSSYTKNVVFDEYFSTNVE